MSMRLMCSCAQEAGEPTAVRDCQDWLWGKKGEWQSGRGGDRACWFKLGIKNVMSEIWKTAERGRVWEDSYARAHKWRGKEKKNLNDNIRKWKDGVGKMTSVVLTHYIHVTRAPWSHDGVYEHAWRAQCELQLSRANRCVSVQWMSDLINHFQFVVFGQPHFHSHTQISSYLIGWDWKLSFHSAGLKHALRFQAVWLTLMHYSVENEEALSGPSS